MEVKNVNTDGITVIPLMIKSEPINGSYHVINSGSTFFEIYSKINPDPDDNLFDKYDLNKYFVIKSINSFRYKPPNPINISRVLFS
mgnify:CR=1 FL=1